MHKHLAVAFVALLVMAPAFAEARGFSGGGRSGGFSSGRSASFRSSSFSRPSAPSYSRPVTQRASGFSNARAINTQAARTAARPYTVHNTTVNSYGGYGGGGGFFTGYMMGSLMHPFGFGYGAYGGGYGYGTDAYGNAYYPSTGSMVLSYALSAIFLIVIMALFIWILIAANDSLRTTDDY